MLQGVGIAVRRCFHCQLHVCLRVSIMERAIYITARNACIKFMLSLTSPFSPLFPSAKVLRPACYLLLVRCLRSSLASSLVLPPLIPIFMPSLGLYQSTFTIFCYANLLVGSRVHRRWKIFVICLLQHAMVSQPGRLTGVLVLLLPSSILLVARSRQRGAWLDWA
jgi:hypothetical protein